MNMLNFYRAQLRPKTHGNRSNESGSIGDGKLPSITSVEAEEHVSRNFNGRPRSVYAAMKRREQFLASI
jgi:hypothetical protein